MTSSKIIQINLVNGTPDGVRYARFIGQTERVYVAPRSQIKVLGDFLKKSGVYMLIGDDNDNSDSLDTQPTQLPASVYVGLSGDINNRSRHHDRQKAFWKTIVLLTGIGDDFNTTISSYLESSLIKIIKNRNVVTCLNKQIPSPHLSEESAVIATKFLDSFITLLPAIGFSFASPTPDTRQEQSSDDKKRTSPVFTLKSKIPAKAVEIDGRFIVLKDSQCRVAEKTSLPKNAERIRVSLQDRGILQGDNQVLHFVEDVEFSSSSAAASTITGTSINGPENWIDSEGKSYKNWLEQYDNDLV